MVTEQNDAGKESQVEITDIPVDTNAPSTTDASTPVEEPTPVVEESNESIENSNNSIQVNEPQSKSQTEQPSDANADLQSSEAFRKYQSSTDKRMAELETQLQKAEQQRIQAEEQANLNKLDDQVATYEQQLAQKYVTQGLDEQMARQLANDQALMAKEAYLAKIETAKVSREQQKFQGELSQRTQLAKAYELAAQYQVPYQELQDINDPVTMEKMAKNLFRTKKLEEQLAKNTPAQTMTNASPSPDVAPTDAEDVIDRYNSGDPNVTTDMARTAAKKLGLSIFG
tara:strand:+ start:490 stop:1344 length:855 start_codon:yes stop_codon:yes gene_type:complete